MWAMPNQIGEKEEIMAHSINSKLRGMLTAFIALVAALMLVPGTAFADPIGGNTVNIGNLKPGDQVYLYQVVKTDRNTTTNVATNDFVTDFGVDFDDWTAANTPKDPDDDSATVQGYASTIATYVNSHKDEEWGGQGYKMYGPQTAGENNQATFTDVDAGQYLVVVQSNADATRVYQNTIISVVPTTNGSAYVPTTVTRDLKYTDMTDTDTGSVVNKTINGFKAVDNVDANDTVTFTITAPIPRYVANLDSRTFSLADSMSDGFVYADDLTVQVGSATLQKGTDYTLGSDDGFFMSITLSGNALKNYAGQTLTVTYKATLAQDDHKPAYDAPETNQVTLTFSKNSNDSQTSTANDTVYMSVYGVTFTKVSSDDKKPLSGATFEIKDADGNVIASNTTGPDGVFTVNGALAANQEYTLVETSAPAGYQPINDLTFKIESDGDATDGGTLYQINNGTIKDEPSNFFATLPTTGGMGTVAFTAAGVVIIAGAAAFIVRSRKNNN